MCPLAQAQVRGHAFTHMIFLPAKATAASGSVQPHLIRCCWGLAATVEYTNPHPGESMVVWLKKPKQFICDESNPEQQLILVNTRFQDLVPDAAGKDQWVAWSLSA